jgi:hypothetical protein
MSGSGEGKKTNATLPPDIRPVTIIKIAKVKDKVIYLNLTAEFTKL